MKRILDVLGLFALLPAAGCYTYHTVRIDDVQPDIEVRLRVTPEASGQVARAVGYLTQDVEGTVAYVRQDTVWLTVASPTAPEARSIQLLYQRLDVPVSQVLEVRRRSFSPWKTYACIGAALAGGGVLAAVAFTEIINGGGQGDGMVTDNHLVAPQLFRHDGSQVGHGVVPSGARLLVPLGRLQLHR